MVKFARGDIELDELIEDRLHCNVDFQVHV